MPDLTALTGDGIWKGRIGICVRGDRHEFSLANRGDATRMAEAIERLLDAKRTRARRQ